MQKSINKAIYDVLVVLRNASTPNLHLEYHAHSQIIAAKNQEKGVDCMNFSKNFFLSRNNSTILQTKLV